MLTIDLLHAFHLGAGRDLVGGLIKYLAQHGGFLVGANQKQRLESAYTLCTQFLRDQGRERLSISGFHKARLNWGTDFPSLRSKGADTYLILWWLAEDFLPSAPGVSPLVVLCAQSCHAWLRILLRSGPWLSNDERCLSIHLGRQYLVSYCVLAEAAQREGVKLWKCRPKLHLVTHLVHSAATSPRNVFMDSCFVDEGFVGRIMRIATGTHVKTMGRRTLERCLGVL